MFRFPKIGRSRFTCKSGRVRRGARRPRFETLEARRVLAPVINEIHFPIVTGTDQYIEIRGGANESLGAGVYLAAIDGDAPIGGNPGLVHTLFDLSGLSLGANGFLAIRQAGSPYPVHSDATVLDGTAGDGFAGLRAAGEGAGVDRFSDTTGVTNRIDHVLGSNTFLLIQSNTPPTAGLDIDANNDGVPDGAFASWTVLDAISMLDGGAADFAYANLVYARNGAGNVPAGATVVTTTPAVLMNYVGRNDDTTGSTPADWIVSESQTFGDPDGIARLSEATTLPPQFTGRRLDHLGAPNFLASVHGTVFLDADSDGVQDNGESGVPGVTVYIDHNNNGVQDSFTTVVEPDDFPNWDGANSQETTIRNDVPGVTFSVAKNNNTQHPDAVPASVVEWPFNSVTGIKVFSQAGVSFFSDAFRFRLDFYEPVSAFSIAVEGSSAGSVGRVIAIDENGAVINTIDTAPLAAGQQATLSITRPSADIARVITYGATDFVHFDRLEFTQPERSAISGADGSYEIPRVFPGSYVVRQAPAAGLIQVSPPAPGAHAAAIPDTRNVAGLNFGNRPNALPEVAPQVFSVAENSGAGAAVGTVAATDSDGGQDLTFEITGGSGEGRFNINAATGAITVAAGANLNFEAVSSFTLDVRVRDNAPIPASTTATMTINLLDVNEAPTDVTLSAAAVAEDADTASGAVVVGTLSLVDPDANPSPTFELTSGAGSADNGLFEISGAALRVKQGVALDHETKPSLQVRVKASDGPHAREKAFAISVSNVNEPATAVSVTPGAVSESADTASGPVAVGQLATDDPDADADYAFELVSGDGDDDNGDFQVSGGQLLVNQGVSLDLETKAEFSIRVRATDGAGEVESILTIAVADENEPPQISDGEFTLAENTSAGTAVGAVTASDPDQGQTLAYAIVGGTGQAAFSIDAVTGEIVVADSGAVDFEAAPSLTLVVRVTDDGLPPLASEATVTINLTDVDDAPTGLTIDNDEIAEDVNTPAGPVAVGQLTAVAPGGGDRSPHTFTLVAGEGDADNGLFEIAGAELRLRQGVALDHESAETLSLRVEVSNGVDASEEVLVIRVADANEPLTDVTLSSDTVVDSADTGDPVTVGELAVIDPDDPDAFAPYTFSLSAGAGATDNSAFQVDGNVLRFKAGVSLDSAVKDSYSLRVRATDGVHSLSKILTVHLTQGNEPPVAQDDTATVNRDQAATIVVLGNDSDSDGQLDPSSVAITVAPQHGSAEVQAGGAIRYTPAAGFTGQVAFQYTVSDNEGAVSNAAQVTIDVLGGPGWQNTAMPEDADGDGAVELFDLLLVVQFLRDNGTVHVLEGAPENGQAMVDVNGDGVATLSDVLAVVTHLRSQQSAAAEPEAPNDANLASIFLSDDEDEWTSDLQQVARDVAMRRAAS